MERENPVDWNKIVEAISILDDVEILKRLEVKAHQRRDDILKLRAAQSWFDWLRRL
jgi:hypothetical protein